MIDGKPAKPKRPMPYKGQDVTPAQKSEIGRSAKSKPNPSVPTKNKNEVPNIIVIDSRLNAMDKPPRPLSTSLITPETHDSKSVPSSPQAIHKHPPVMSTPSTPQPHHKVKVTRSVSQEPAKPVKPVPKRTAVEKSISSISPSASSSPHAGSRAALLLKGAIGNLSNSLGSISPIKTQSSRNDASTSKKQHSTECSTSVSNDIPKVTKVLNNSKAINNTYARPRPVPPRPPLRKDENEDEEGYVAVASSTSDSPYDYCEVRKFTHIDKEASANQETSDKSSPQVAPSTTNYTSIDVATMDPGMYACTSVFLLHFL